MEQRHLGSDLERAGLYSRPLGTQDSYPIIYIGLCKIVVELFPFEGQMVICYSSMVIESQLVGIHESEKTEVIESYTYRLPPRLNHTSRAEFHN